MSVRFTVVYWRDIPAHIVGKKGRERLKVPLSERFLHAIDRAAMRAGRGSSNDYLADWRREHKDCDGDLQQAMEAEAARLEAAFTEEELKLLVKAKGLQESTT